jgi:hypothetical protein
MQLQCEYQVGFESRCLRFRSCMLHLSIILSRIKWFGSVKWGVLASRVKGGVRASRVKGGVRGNIMLMPQ